MTYALAETFYTLQGEGYHVGTPSLFIRFAGCSMWTGQQEHRERGATRNGAARPLFCDLSNASLVLCESLGPLVRFQRDKRTLAIHGHTRIVAL